MNRAAHGLALLAALLLATNATLRAEERPTQPLVLPMVELLRQLDPQREWQFVPLADYRALVDAAHHAADAAVSAPGGAWIEQATVSGELQGDRELRCTAELTVVSVAVSATRCPLFATAPASLGAVTIDGQPALYVLGAALELVVPAPGRHHVAIAWGTRLADGDERVHRGQLVLPLAAGADVHLRATTPGGFSGSGVIEESGASPGWRITGSRGGALALSWHPGRLSGSDSAVFGVEQAVQVAVVDGPSSFHWVARLAARRGSLPTSLDLVLPAGWTMGSPGPGVVALTGPGTAADPVHLTLDAQAREIACDGFIAAAAPVGLPLVQGAAYQGGTVTLSASSPLAYTLPGGWLATPATTEGGAVVRRFALAAPDAGMRVALRPAADGLTVASTASVAIGPTAHGARLTQVLTISGAGRPRFALPLQLPAGWQLTAFAATPPGAIAELAGSDDPGTLVPGASVTVLLTPRPTNESVTLTLTLSGDTTAVPVRLAAIPSAQRLSSRLVVLAAPGLEVGITAGGWRLAERAVAFPADRADQVRAELFCTGSTPPLALAVAPRRLAATAEAVCYLLPRGPDDTWARIDLRLQVQEGELTRLRLALPVAAGAHLHAEDALFTVTTLAGAVLLEARAPWRGEHLLRIEGPLAPGEAGRLPQLTLSAGAEGADAIAVPLRQITAVQAPTDLDLAIVPGRATLPLDGDELPAWSRPIPGALLAGAWRMPAGAAPGTLTLVQRALAAVPAGFIDRASARTQVSAGGVSTWLRLRLAAPGLAELPLGLPEGSTLLAATIDGQATAVRRHGHELVLPLPGRTQVGIVLLYALPALPDADGELVQPLPRLAGLPITTCSWQVAIDDRWRVIPVAAPDALPLTMLVDGSPLRPWFATWRTPGVGSDVPPPPGLGQQAGDDARQLVAADPAPAAPGEPTLILAGQLLAGERSGDGAVLRLRLADLERLRGADRTGWALAAMCGVALFAVGWRQRLLLAAAALLTAWGLHTWQIGAGPLLALAEGLPVALLVLPLLRWLLRLATARRPRLQVALSLLMVAACSTHGAAADSVLMGYDHLDAAGVPIAVRVALTRDQLTTLWQRAHGETAAPAPVCVLATGAARYALDAGSTAVEVLLTMPVAVPGESWQEVHLPLGTGTVRSVRAERLGRVLPPAELAARSAGGVLIVACPPRSQFLLSVAFALPLHPEAATSSFALPVLPTHGGEARLRLPSGWTPSCAGGTVRAPAGNDGEWLLDLPVGVQTLAWQLRRTEAETSHELHRTLDQTLRASLAPGRVEWDITLLLGAQGGTLREARLHLPAGLVITTVSGPALAAWRQDGADLEISWSEPRTGAIAVHAQGLQPRSAAPGHAPAAWSWPGAERNTGRLDLVHASDEHFLRPDQAEIERAEPRPGAALAVRWSDHPNGLAIAWEAAVNELRVVQQGALVAGLDRLRATLITTLSGRGSCDALTLRLPAPWRLTVLPAGVTATFPESGNGPAANADRTVTLRTAEPWRAGTSVTLQLETERGGLGDTFSVPDGTPTDPALVLDRQEWLFGDAGDRRLRLEDAGRFTPLSIEALASVLAAQGVALRPGESWRSACERRSGPAPLLSLRADSTVVQVIASHYLVIGQEQVRWWARLAWRIDQGALQELRCTLPTGARLVALHAADLGSWRMEGAELIATLAAPARRAVALDLSLEVPLADAGHLMALATPAGQALSAQTVAVVEEDELGLLHLDPDGLEPIASAELAGNLPDGVDAARVQQRWRAARPGWSLGIAREAATASGGADGVATLVDVLSVIAPDGELRSRATWHVLNRTRQVLALHVPSGLALWEARVDGAVVRPRLADATARAGAADAGQELLLPVRTLRPGEATLRIELTWRQQVADTARFRPGAPLLGELRIMQTLWRFVPPPGHALTRRDGTLAEIPATHAAAQRVRRVIEDLKRLRGVGTLSDSGVQRLHAQLEVLDLELDDYLVDLKGLGGEDADLSAAAASARTPEAAGEAKAAIADVVSNRRDIQSDLQRLDALAGTRAGRRKALGLWNGVQTWNGRQVLAPAQLADYLTRLDDGDLPWQSAQPLAGGAALGAGEPAPGHRASATASLLGIDLIPPTDGEGLVLRGQGSDLQVELALTREPAARWPWLALVGGALLAGATLLVRRR